MIDTDFDEVIIHQKKVYCLSCAEQLEIPEFFEMV
jgi:deoxycytidine triphosphate deaminase